MSNIIPFNFNNHNIRTAIDNSNKIWFVAKDITETLEYTRTSDGLEHCKYCGNLPQLNKINNLPPATKWIPESDVYRLIMRSNMANAVEFQDLVVEEILPTIRKTGSYHAPQAPTQIKPLLEANRLFKSNLMIAKAIFKGNQAVLSANQATMRVTSVNVLDNLGANALIAEKKEILLTASDIGKEIGLSGMKVNLLLEEKGLIKSYRDHKNNKHWELTSKGEKFGEALDTSKKHGDGTPVKQIKWYSKIINLLKANEAGNIINLIRD